MDINYLLEIVNSMSPIQPTLKSNDFGIETNVWNEIDMKENEFETGSYLHLFETLQYIFDHYGKGIFVKIVDNKLENFIPFKNRNIEKYWEHIIDLNIKGKNLSLDNYVIKNYNQDTDISWLLALFEYVCSRRVVPDCEFFINSERSYPIVTKNRSIADKSIHEVLRDYDIPLSQHAVLSFCTSDDFKDFAFPTEMDWSRMMSDRFGILDFHNMKWDDKKNVFVFCSEVAGRGVNPVLYPVNKRLQLVYKLKALSKDNENGNVVTGITDFNENEIVIEDSKPFFRKTFSELRLESEVDPVSFYKFVFIVDGEGSPEEMSNVLFSGSCIIRVESENGWRSWFDEGIKPDVHFKTVRSDLENLNEVMKWCLQNDAKCADIASRARSFALSKLSRNGIFDYVQTLLYKISEKGVTDYMSSIETVQYYLQKKRLFNTFLAVLPDFVPTLKNPDLKPHECDLLYTSRYNYAYNKAVTIILSNIHDIYIKKRFVVSRNVHVYQLYNLYLIGKDYIDFIAGMNDAYAGFDCINELTKEIPNFCHTIYAEFINDKFRVYTENIKGDTLDLFFEKNILLSVKHQVLIQICLSLQLAYERFCFVHGNLEPEHVVVQTLSEPIKIIYRLVNDTFAIQTRFVPVITNFKYSKYLSSFENKPFYKMYVGHHCFPWNDQECQPTVASKHHQNFEERCCHHESPGKDIKYLLKKLGKKFLPPKNVNLSICEANETPLSIMKEVVPKENIKKSGIRFGKTRDEPVVTGSPRFIADRLNNDNDRQNKVVERIYKKELPVDKTSIGNVVFEYEIKQNLLSTLGNCDINFNVKINSEKIKNCLDFVKQQYEHLINQTSDLTLETTANPTYKGMEFDLWAVRMFIRKYMAYIYNHNLFEKFVHHLKLILKASIEESIKIGKNNTYVFYEKYMKNLE